MKFDLHDSLPDILEESPYMLVRLMDIKAHEVSQNFIEFFIDKNMPFSGNQACWMSWKKFSMLN